MPDCDACGGIGWLETTEDMVERCDACKLFGNDVLALEAWAEVTLVPLLDTYLAAHKAKDLKLREEIGVVWDERRRIHKATIARLHG